VKIAAEPGNAKKEDPCLTVGDVLIALESAGVGHFLTLNGIESQHFCRILGQTLIVHPVDPTKEAIICDRNDPRWPEFGARQGTEST
jgi:hypothetical protein